ncbi:hypothetical protein ACEQ8H_000825 [Pleosporales sp. CAS-2024a]
MPDNGVGHSSPHLITTPSRLETSLGQQTHTTYLPATMPAIDAPPPHSPLSSRKTPAHPPRDWPLIWVLSALSLILSLQLVLAIAWIRVHNVRSKARWQRLRQRGVVIVSGAALLWSQDVAAPALKPSISHQYLQQALEKQRVEEVGDDDI